MPAPAQTSTAAVVAAGRRLLEQHGPDALTMRQVADAVGVRPPSLYKRVSGRAGLIQLILEDVTDEVTALTEAAEGSGDPAADLRAMAYAYRDFARANPVAYALMYGPQPAPGATARSQRSSVPLLRTVTALAGPDRALPAARTIVAWANGFIMMELAGAFRLGGDLDQAWGFGLDRILAAIKAEAGDQG
ncbi:MAG TPA: TetR/AcrR family transcriptional regulator [Trebonia sp.]|nr:TetR/AcrR family transcriptional regulator [Trebonia sp.]